MKYNQLDVPIEENDLLTFGQVAKRWASIHKQEVLYSTWRDYVSSMNKHTLPVFKDRPIGDISYMEILEFRNSLQKKFTGHRQHIFLAKDSSRMTPDHFRKVVWVPAFEKPVLNMYRRCKRGILLPQ